MQMNINIDENDIKFMFCMKNWFLGFIIPLTHILLNPKLTKRLGQIFVSRNSLSHMFSKITVLKTFVNF